MYTGRVRVRRVGSLSEEGTKWRRAGAGLDDDGRRLPASAASEPGRRPTQTQKRMRRVKTKSKRLPERFQVWAEARKRYWLSDAHVQMARELGMNSKKFGKLANEKQEPWKLPLPDYIEELYERRLGKERPDQVRSIEEMAARREQKRSERRERKKARSEEGAGEAGRGA